MRQVFPEAHHILLNGAAFCQAGFPLCLQGQAFLLLLPFPQMAPPESTEAEYCKKKHKQYPRGSDNSGFNPRLRQQFLQLCFEPGSLVQFHGFRGGEADGGVCVSFNLYGCRAEYGPGRNRRREVTELHIRYDLNILLVRVFREEKRNFFRGAENGGSIVNIASMTALRGNRGQLVYSATKGAVVSLTKSAAKELAEKKIRVNAIAPGLTNTDMMKQADPEKLQSRINNICMGRLAEPEDIAKACLFMVSDLSTYVSGQVLAVDGCTIM